VVNWQLEQTLDIDFVLVSVDAALSVLQNSGKGEQAASEAAFILGERIT